MQVDVGLHLELSQKLIMTPQLCQAIAILQLSAPDLADLVQQELLCNPVLEVEEVKASESPIPESPPPAMEPPVDYFDWAEYFNDSSEPFHKSHVTRDTVEFPERPDGAGTLADHLELQLDLASPRPVQRVIGRYIIGNIDENGYFTTTVEETAEILGVTEGQVAEVLALVQTFDPAGVGARDLRECLRIQVDQAEICDRVVDAIIDKYLEPAAAGRFSWIAGKIGESVERVQEAMQCIRRLNPKPGCAVGAANLPSYIIPDITVKKISGEFVILINDTQVPGLKINSYYRSLFREAEPDTRKYIEGRMNAAVWLIRSIEHRRRTLYKLMEALITLQKGFFEEGPKKLSPMTMKLVAEAINVHESTVSRATAHKHVDTPHGLFSLRSFFSTGLAGTDGVTLSATRIKREIKELVARENPTQPLSDQAIVELLIKSGICLSRRTVTKYREELGIMTSLQRKRG